MAYALIASVDKSSAGTTGSIDTTGADLIVIGKIYDGGSAFVLSDSKTNTWTTLTISNDGADTTRTVLFYSVDPTVGTGHTFSLSGAGYGAIFVSAWSGVVAAPFDQENGAGTTSGTSLSTGSITPSENNCLLIALLGLGGNGNTPVQDTGWTLLLSENGTSGVTYGGAMAYQIQTTATARNHAWAWTTTSTGAARIASFKAAAAAGGWGRLLGGSRNRLVVNV